MIVCVPYTGTLHHLLYSDYIDGLMSFDVDASHLKTIPGPGGYLMQSAHL